MLSLMNGRPAASFLFIITSEGSSHGFSNNAKEEKMAEESVKNLELMDKIVSNTRN